MKKLFDSPQGIAIVGPTATGKTAVGVEVSGSAGDARQRTGDR